MENQQSVNNKIFNNNNAGQLLKATQLLSYIEKNPPLQNAFKLHSQQQNTLNALRNNSNNMQDNILDQAQANIHDFFLFLQLKKALNSGQGALWAVNNTYHSQEHGFQNLNFAHKYWNALKKGQALDIKTFLNNLSIKTPNQRNCLSFNARNIKKLYTPKKSTFSPR